MTRDVGPGRSIRDRALSAVLDAVGGLLRFSVRRPGTVALTTLVVTLAASLFIPRVGLLLDGRSLIPSDRSQQLDSDRAAEIFRLRDVIVVGVTSPETVYSPEALALVARLSSELEALEGIAPGSVVSLSTLPRLSLDDDSFDPDPLLGRGGPVTDAMVLQVRRETEDLGLDDGVVVSADGRATAVLAEVETAADRYLLLERIRELVAGSASGCCTVEVSGTAIAQAVLGRAAALDLSRLVPAVLLLLAVVLTLAFRHPLPAMVALAEIGASLLITAGVMGLVGESIFVTTLVLPVILIVIGVSDDVYALNRWLVRTRERDEEPATAIVASFHEVASPILVTALTTMVGLVALSLSGLEPQRVFGLYGALSIGVSTILTFTLVPALLALAGARGVARRRTEDGWSRAALAYLRRLEGFGSARALVCVALLILCGAWIVRDLRVEDDWVRNLPADSDVVRGDRVINRQLAGTIRLELMADGAAPRALLDPETFEAIGRLEERLESRPFVGAVHSVFSEVVRVQAALEAVPYDQLRADLAAGTRRLQPMEIEQSLLLLSSLRRSPLVKSVDDGYQRARLTVFLRFANYSRIREVVELVRSTDTGLEITPFGDGWISFSAVRLLVVGQVQSVLVALLADALLLLLLLRSARLAALAIAPITVSVLIVFALLTLSGTPLGIANSMFAAIALGIGVDYSIHLVEHYRQGIARGDDRHQALREAYGKTAPAILKSAVAISAGLSVLAFSEVLPNLQLGLLVALSLAICALMTLTVVPSLVLALPSRERAGAHAEPGPPLRRREVGARGVYP